MVQTHIRDAVPADASALARVQQGIYAEGRWFVGSHAPSVSALHHRLKGLNPRNSLYLVAVSGRELCGWLELNRLQPERMQHVALLTIAIDRAWRRQGLGRELLHEAYDWCRKVGISKITLNVRAGNTGAISLYEVEGFRHEGREVNQFVTPDGYEDNIIMGREIRPA